MKKKIGSILLAGLLLTGCNSVEPQTVENETKAQEETTLEQIGRDTQYVVDKETGCLYTVNPNGDKENSKPFYWVTGEIVGCENNISVEEYFASGN